MKSRLLIATTILPIIGNSILFIHAASSSYGSSTTSSASSSLGTSSTTSTTPKKQPRSFLPPPHPIPSKTSTTSSPSQSNSLPTFPTDSISKPTTKSKSKSKTSRANSSKKTTFPAVSTPALNDFSHLRSFHPQIVQHFIQSRCSNMRDNKKTNAIWVFEGSLIDPFNGRRIAEVEGVELVRQLTELSHDDDNHYGGNRYRPQTRQKRLFYSRNRLGDLAASSLLFPPFQPSSESSQSVSSDNFNKYTAPSWDYSSTVLSRKLFCYRDPQDKRKLLSSIRIRPGVGKVRHIPMREAVAVFDTATTFISRDDGRELVLHTEWPDGRTLLADAEKPAFSDWNIKQDDDHHHYDKFHHEDKSTNPNKQKIGITAPTTSTSTFEYTVYAKGQKGPTQNASSNPFKKNSTSLPHTLKLTRTQKLQIQQSKLKGKQKNNINNIDDWEDDGESTISPPRTKLIQFGPDKITNDKYGARESYSYTFPSPQPIKSTSDVPIPFFKYAPPRIQNNLSNWWDSRQKRKHSKKKSSLKSNANAVETDGSPCVVRYTRYGECPPWYGAGRMCTLELVGRKVSSLEDVPPLVASLAAEQLTGFTSVNYPIVPSLPESSFLSSANSNEQNNLDDDNPQKWLQWKKQFKKHERATKKAIQWFREDGKYLKLSQDDHDDDENNVFLRRLQNTLPVHIWKKVQKATTGGS